MSSGLFVLEASGLRGRLGYDAHSCSYIVTIVYNGQYILTKVFGNGVSAENCLLDLLEHPEWTILQYA